MVLSSQEAIHTQSVRETIYGFQPGYHDPLLLLQVNTDRRNELQLIFNYLDSRRRGKISHEKIRCHNGMLRECMCKLLALLFRLLHEPAGVSP